MAINATSNSGAAAFSKIERCKPEESKNDDVKEGVDDVILDSHAGIGVATLESDSDRNSVEGDEIGFRRG